MASARTASSRNGQRLGKIRENHLAASKNIYASGIRISLGGNSPQDQPRRVLRVLKLLYCPPDLYKC